MKENKERILAYKKSKQLSEGDLKRVSAAGGTAHATQEMTFCAHAGDVSVDVTTDK